MLEGFKYSDSATKCKTPFSKRLSRERQTMNCVYCRDVITLVTGRCITLTSQYLKLQRILEFVRHRLHYLTSLSEPPTRRKICLFACTKLFTGQMHFLSPNQQLTKTYSGDGSINCHYRFDENCKKVFSGSVAT